jgi:DNA-binding CsgD family transcriptional regulator
VSQPGTRLLERDGELELIEDRIAAGREGQGSVLVFEGPAGIGKTELLAAARARAEHAGLEVLGARGGELEQSLGFGVVRQLFEGTIAAASAAERRRLFAGAAGLAAPAFDLAAEAAPSESGLRMGDPAASIQHGLYWLTANLAERSPLLFTVDDLQWADAASVRWLIYLARRLEGLSVLIAGAIRSGEPGSDPGLLAGLLAETATEPIRPGALSEEATAKVVRARLGLEASDTFCAACHRASGGNPFLVRELVEALDRDEVPPTDGSAGHVESLAPETVSRSMLLRMARLPEGAEPLARAVSVLGSEAEPRHAASLAALDDETAVAAADGLAAASILAAGRPLRFAHPLLRAAVYEQMPESERALAHAKAARLLVEEHVPAEKVAAQLLRAHPASEEWAVESLRGAAQASVARGVPEAAVAYLRRALVEPPPAPLRTTLLGELLEAGLLAIDMSIFEGISDDPVAELTHDTEAPVDRGAALGGWLYITGRMDEGTALAERQISAAAEAGDYLLAMRRELQLLPVLQIEPAEAIERLDRFAGRVEPGTPEERAWLAMRAWWQSFHGGPASAAAELARRALEEGRIIEDQHASPVAGQPMMVLLRADELDEAEAWIDRLLDDARRRGSVGGFISGIGLRGQLAYRRGQVSNAADDGRRGLELARQHEVAFGIPLQTAWLVEALVECGELSESQQQLTASGLDGEILDHYWFTPARFSRARLRLAQGRVDEALDDLRRLLGLSNRTWPAAYPLASMIALASAERDPGEARRLLDLELASGREWGTPRGIGVALRALGLVQGGARGIELLREAVEVLEASPARLEHARALADLGAALRRAKRRAESREVLRQAVDIAYRCGAEPIAERAREELAATGAKPRRTMFTGVESLTPSELRVARMAAQDMQNKEIAQALFVTVKTVETHLGHVYSKLGISSRKELGAALVSGKR